MIIAVIRRSLLRRMRKSERRSSRCRLRTAQNQSSGFEGLGKRLPNTCRETFQRRLREQDSVIV
jgi:hypothetical protein